MMTNRVETVILTILEFVGLLVALHGLWFQHVSKVSLTGIFYCSVWYILCVLCYLVGLVSISMETTEDELKADSQGVLQFHYLCGWLAVVVGYPLLVTYTWLMLYPTQLAHAHLILSVIPILSLIGRKHEMVLRTTQICVGLAAISHFAICYLAGDTWGMASTCVMVISIVALSTPTEYQVWSLNSRELFIVGLTVTSLLMNTSIVSLGNPKHKVKF